MITSGKSVFRYSTAGAEIAPIVGVDSLPEPGGVTACATE
jgi:hypothetical protein